MKKNKKKGFTLVELLVVIAIVAILATVSVVAYLSFTEKAKDSNDQVLVKQLNTLLQADEALDGKPSTMHEAVNILDRHGFVVEKLTPTSTKNEFIYDVTTNRFEVWKVDEVTNGTLNANKWVVVKDEARLNEITDQYSVYLASSFTETDTPDNKLTVQNGFDAGLITTAFDVIYNNTVSKKSIIRTNGGTLNVIGPNDIVYHYGESNLVNVKEVANNSYHEFGTVASLNLTKGRIVAEKGSKISEVMVTHDAVITNIKIESKEKNLIESIVDCTNKLPSSAITGTDVSPMVGKVVSTLAELDGALWPNSGQPASYVVLKNDIDMTGTPLATKGKLVLNGNGFTLKGKRPANSEEILKNESTIFLSFDPQNITYYDVTIKNLTIQNTSSSRYASVIASNDKIKSLTLSNVNLISTATNGYGLRFGGNADYSSPELRLNLNNVNISMAKNGYGIAVERKTIGNIENTEIFGFSSLTLKDSAKNSKINILNSKFLNENNMEGEPNSYGCIISETNYVHVNVNESYINALVNKPNTFQYAFLYKPKTNYSSGDIKVIFSNHSIVDGKVFGVVAETYNPKFIDIICKDSKFTQNIEDVQMIDKDGYIPLTHKVIKSGIYYNVVTK